MTATTCNKTAKNSHPIKTEGSKTDINPPNDSMSMDSSDSSYQQAPHDDSSNHLSADGSDDLSAIYANQWMPIMAETPRTI
jgi:hypothetical protein